MRDAATNFTLEGLIDISSVFTYNKSEEKPDIFYNRLQNYINYTSQFNTSLTLQNAIACDVSDGITVDDFINYLKNKDSSEQPYRYKFRIAASNAYILDALSKESLEPEMFNGNEVVLPEEYQALINQLIGFVIKDIPELAMLFSDLSEEEITILENA